METGESPSNRGDPWSERFTRPIRITRHARERMAERHITGDLLYHLIETGQATHKDERRLWLSKKYPERDDNLICAAVVLEDAVVVKTVMHHWQLVE